jgi:hypothetical protein
MPLAVPVGVETWETSIRLLTTQEATQRVAILLPQRAQITSFEPSVVIVGVPLQAAVAVPLEKQIWVALDLDRQENLTVDTNQTNNAPIQGNFVTLASLAARLWNIKAMSPKPELGFQFRSKQAAAGASGFATDLLISVTVTGYYLDEQGQPARRDGRRL